MLEFRKAILPGLALCLVMAPFVWTRLSCAGEPAAMAPTIATAKTPPAKAEGKSQPGSTRKIEEGDLVTIDYSAFSEDGELVYSTRPHDAGAPRVAGYREPSGVSPERVIAGKAARFPGVGESLVGMAESEQKRITIPADKAFGPSNPELVKSFPVTKILDRTIRMSAPDYVKQFGTFPVEGREVDMTPYVKARVGKVGDAYVELEVTAGDIKRFDEEFGSVEVRRQGDQFKVTLTPKIGAPFRTEAGVGRIIAEAAGSFIVDFNPPLAGTQASVDVKVLKMVRASELSDMQITWIEDHDKGLASARASGKPAVLVLYADWCQWCKKLLTESFPDPRIGELKDRLVWIKVDSDRFKDYGTKYEQKSFPVIVLFEADGTMAQKIEGYLDAAALRDALGALIDGRQARAL
jgi:FKBP-type peptidyl-prolyl cis-trans isomerase 2